MANEPPVAAAVQPTPPRRRNRRRQQSEGSRHRRFWQASTAHASGSPAADPAWPDYWAAAPAANVDGWTVTSENPDKTLENSLWTMDRCLSSCAQLTSASTLSATNSPTAFCVFRGNTMFEERDYPTCLLCCEQFKVMQPCEPASMRVPLSTISHCLWAQVVAFGKCGHKDICAECILQLLMLYKNYKCPLCNAQLNDVSR